jgi:hypothetical protein
MWLERRKSGGQSSVEELQQKELALKSSAA